MKNKIIFITILSLVFILILIQMVKADISQEYLNEFSVESETCQLADLFVYDIHDPWFFNSQHMYTTYPTIYSCCNNNTCTSIIFDANHKTLLNDKYVREIIDINYIRFNLYSGNLSTTSFRINGLDLCNYFGFDDVKQESLNLASSTVKTAASMSKTENAVKVVSAINTAKKVGILGNFNPVLLISGGACMYDNKKLNIVIQNLFLLDSYLNNINKGYSQEKYVSNLTNTMTSSKQLLEEYLKSPTAIARGGTNFIFNSIKFLLSFIFSPNEKHEIDKTEYQLVESVKNQIKNYDSLLINPNNDAILQKNNERINLKSDEFFMHYTPLKNEYNNITKINPSPIRVFLINLFFKPNFDLKNGSYCLEIAKNSLEIAEDNYNSLKFNSAINALNETESNLNCAIDVLTIENAEERRFDILAFCILILVILALYFLVKKLMDL